MITTFEGIGANYRKRAGRMLDEVQKALLRIGIYRIVRPEGSCHLIAYTSSGRGYWEFLFIAHPTAGYIEITVHSPQDNPEQKKKRRIARLYLNRIGDPGQAIRRILIDITSL